MKNKKNFAVASLILSLLSLIPLIITPDSLTGAKIFAIIAIFLGIAGIVLGFIGKSTSKGLSISGIILGIISCIILFTSLMGLLMIEKVTNCIDNGNGTSTCSYLEQQIEVSNSLLREDQIKK